MMMHSTPRSGKGSFSERNVCVVYFLRIFTIFKCISPVLCTIKAISYIYYIQYTFIRDAGRSKRATAFFEAFRPPTPSRNFVSDHLKSINPIFVPPTTTFPPPPQASRYVFFTFSPLHTPPRLFYPIFLLSVES